MIQQIWTSFINSVVVATSTLEDILLFTETNPAAANAFAALIAFPFILVILWQTTRTAQKG